MRSLARLVPAMCHAPRSRYKNCIATLAPAVHLVARIAARVAEHWASYRSRVTRCVVTQGCPLATTQGLSPKPCLSGPVSQYSLLYCDSNLEKMGSSPFQLHCTFSFFFFFIHFFFIVPATGKPLKNIYYIFFVFQYNQINLLKFILFIFLPVLHTVKP